jgi:hypothetical protein
MPYPHDMSTNTGTIIHQVLANRHAVIQELDKVHELAWDVVEKSVLELCRLRISMLLGCPSELDSRMYDVDENKVAHLAEWPTSPLFTDCECSCLAFTEHFLIDVASLSDATALSVKDNLGEQGFINFVNALLVVEQRIRLRMIWSKMFEGIDP